MKAAVLERGETGGRFVLQDRPVPVPGSGDIVVRLAASSVNPIETMMRDGYGESLFKWMRDQGPIVLGLDGAGVVTAVGSDVSSLRVGDAVMAATWPYKSGFYAESIAVPASFAVPIPDGVGFMESAVVPYAGLTACAVLEAAGQSPRQSSGQRVFIHGGSGGVGHMLVQLCAGWGAEVTVTCSAGNAETITALGAQHVIDYKTTDFADVLAEQDVVINCVAPSDNKLYESPFRRVLRKGGCFASLISPTLTLADMLTAPVGLGMAVSWGAAARLRWRLDGKHHRWVYFKPDAGRLKQLADWMAAGALKPLVGARFALEDINAAHARVEQGGIAGKVAVTIDSDLIASRT